MIWSSTINDLIISKRPRLLFFILGVQAGSLIARGRSKDLKRVVNSYNCNKLKRTIMLSAKISELILSIDPYPSFKSQHRCQNPCSGLLCCHRQFILTFNLTAGQVERVGRSKLIQTVVEIFSN